MYSSDTNFDSSTMNELYVKRQRGDNLIIYERYKLTLASIHATEVARRPYGIVDPVSASVYAYQYIDDNDEESTEQQQQQQQQQSQVEQKQSKRSRATRRPGSVGTQFA